MKLPDFLRQNFPASSFPALSKRMPGPTPPTAAVRRTSSSPLTHDLEKTLNEALGKAGLIPRFSSVGLQTTPKPSDVGEHPTLSRGTFVTRTFSNSAGSRNYKLYVPSTHSPLSESPPLIVMLHGCTQSPDDFAIGTRMNEHAEEHGFLVAYPEQPARANASKCWSWFSPKDQRRDSGEPSLIAGITREIASEFRVDPQRIFIAGLSAGGAMAVLLGTTYPELYAAVGVHSGLPACAANNVPSALTVMANPEARVAGGSNVQQHGTPTVTFHGDRDTTVAIGNGIAVSEDAVRAISHTSPLSSRSLTTRTDSGQSYTLTTYADVSGVARVETWVLHGSGHAWSGGSRAGTYTDPAGIDASNEMIRFFFAQMRGRSSSQS